MTRTRVAIGLMMVMAVLTAPAGYAQCTTPPTGMVAWYAGEGNALDIIGSNHGILVGNTSHGPGYVGEGFVFDGNNDYVRVADTDALDLVSGQLTIDAWIFPQVATARIVNKMTSFGTDGYLLDLQSGAPRLIVGGLQIISDNTVPLDAWSHVAATWDGTTGTIYINGVAQSTSTVGSFTSWPTNTLSFLLGMDNSFGNDYQGVIDEVEVFDRALAAEEIQAIVAADHDGKCRPEDPCHAAPPDMISWWKGDADGSDFLDNNDGVLNGDTGFVPGMVANAFDFDGAGDEVDAGDTASLDLAGSITLDAWVRLESYPVDNAHFAPIASKWDDHRIDVSTVTQERAYLLSVNQGYLRFDVSTDGQFIGSNSGSTFNFFFGDSSAVLYSGHPLPLNTWTHVTAVFDAQTGAMRLYLNGNLSNSGIAPFNSVHNSPAPFLIGAGDTGSLNEGRQYFNGQIDEVEIFNRVLSQEEIDSIVDARTTGKCALYKQLDESCGQGRAIEVGLTSPNPQCFEIVSGLGTNVVIRDTVPAEWNVTTSSSMPELSITLANKKSPSTSATKILWDPNSEWDSQLINLMSRPRPKTNPKRYAPTSCGALYLNAGAIAADQTTHEDIAWSNQLCVAAVSDLDGGGIQTDGLGDEDADGVTDYEEACFLGTNPCVADEF